VNILIIEDEKVTADHLAGSIAQLAGQGTFIGQLHSVKEAISYFQNNPAPDLIFSDIQLGDGLSFEIFSAVPVSSPIIFCTAFDEYTLAAFKTNGIDYILKPFTDETLKSALDKFKHLKQMLAGSYNQQEQYHGLLQEFSRKSSNEPESILIYHKDKILPVKLAGVALCYIDREVCNLITFSGNLYFPNKTLDELEKIVGTDFFRINRQFLVNRKAIVHASSYFSRKLLIQLSISFQPEITVSRERTPLFLKWLSGSA